jgi:hypothetical protein
VDLLGELPGGAGLGVGGVLVACDGKREREVHE